MPTTERITVTLPTELVASIDHLEKNRSRFILEAVDRSPLSSPSQELRAKAPSTRSFRLERAVSRRFRTPLSTTSVPSTSVESGVCSMGS